MNLSVDGRIRRSIYVAFVAGLTGFAFDAVAQDAPVPVPPSAAESSVPAVAPAPAEAPAVLPVQSLPTVATAPPAAEKAVKLEKVQVTGSRIRAPNLTSSSPITTVGAQEIKFTGTTRVEDLLNALPQVFADQGGNLANGATGTANVDLRDLGSARTLVLIDGKRVQPGDPGNSEADLNFIPAALIDRVDVLTGGASATYGADAVAGVVNFIMKKNFEGVRVEAQRSVYQHKNDSVFDEVTARRNFDTPSESVWDGHGWDLTGVIGVNTADSKGNVSAYATYRQLDPITQAKRDFSACALNASGANDFACAGSSTQANSRVDSRVFDAEGNLVSGTNVSVNPEGTGDTFRPFSAARDQFNFNPYNYFQRNDERYSLGAFANYEFNKHANVYGQFMFMDDRTNAVIAPSGAFFGNDAYEIQFDNPFLSEQQRNTLAAAEAEGATSTVALIGRRNVEGGPRDSDLRHSSYRILGGVKGELIGDWSYDASYQYGRTTRDNIYRGEFSRQRTIRAIDAVTDGDGNIVCRSVVDGTDPSCVPYNPFSVGGVTQAALDYLTVSGFSNGIVQERVFAAAVTGPTGLRTPWSNEDVGLAIGVEYRDEESVIEFDEAFKSGDLAGQGGASLDSSGGFDVREVYAEARLPIWQDQPLGKELSAELGYRYSDYSSISSTDTYKAGLNYAPSDDIKLRASLNRAVRAPNIGELSQPTNVQLNGSTDPCAGFANNNNGELEDGEASATAEQCSNDPLIGANPGLYGGIQQSPASQYNGQVGTIPGLKAEEADTYTFGFVATPTFVKGLSLSVDYFNITVDGFIAGYGQDTILQACYERGSLCELIQRDSAPGGTFGSLWLGQNGYVVDFTRNTGKLKVSGVDFKADYRAKASQLGLANVGTFVFDFVGTLNLKQAITPIPGDTASTYNCEGKYGPQCGAPISEWRHKLRSTWQMPWYGASASLAWRYIGEVKADGTGATNDRDDKLKGQHYFDLFGSVKVAKAYTMRVGVNNVLDNDPPIIGGGGISSVSGSGNTYPQVYDALGRYLFTSVTVDF